MLSIGDGDTIRVLGQGQQHITVRLACIDAPEMAQSMPGVNYLGGSYLIIAMQQPHLPPLLVAPSRGLRPGKAQTYWSRARTSAPFMSCWSTRTRRTSMTYTHVLNRGPLGVRSPADLV